MLDTEELDTIDDPIFLSRGAVLLHEFFHGIEDKTQRANALQISEMCPKQFKTEHLQRIDKEGFYGYLRCKELAGRPDGYIELNADTYSLFAMSKITDPHLLHCRPRTALTPQGDMNQWNWSSGLAQPIDPDHTPPPVASRW
jgi:hypothetical protein